MEDEETLVLLPPRRFKVINWAKGINVFAAACRQRKYELYKRISKDLNQL